MTASGVKFSERMTRLAHRVAPTGRRIPTAADRARARARRRGRVVRRGGWREILEIVVTTLVVLALWSLWNFGVWGWW